MRRRRWCHVEGHQQSKGSKHSGHRRAAGELTRCAKAAIEAIGETPVFGPFSTDANVAMSLGIPAVTLSWGGEGGNAHALSEWTDVNPERSLPGMSVGLAVLLACAGVDIDQ